MFREIIWLTSFALIIMAIVLVIKMMVPHIKSLEILNEPPSVEKVARSNSFLTA